MTSETQLARRDGVFGALAEVGHLEGGEDVVIHELPRNLNRRDLTGKTSFTIWKKGVPRIHLNVGAEQRAVYERAKEFHHACPAITCRPLFCLERDGVSYFGQEYFDGTPLSELLGTDSISPSRFKRVLNSLFRGMEVDSDRKPIAAALDELSSLEEDLCAIDAFDGSDLHILRNLVFPQLKAGLSRDLLRFGFTNGDFIAQNILVDSEGSAKLVDYEFAGPTSFLGESWVRFSRYSNLPEKFAADALRRIGPHRRWLEAFFWLRQTALEHRTNRSATFHRQVRANLAEVNRLLGTAKKLIESSLFLSAGTSGATRADAVARNDLELRETRSHVERLEERIAALDLERSQLQARLEAAAAQGATLNKQILEKDDEIVRRGQWGLGLENEVKSLQERLSATAAEQAKLLEDRNRSEARAEASEIRLRELRTAQEDEALAESERLRVATGALEEERARTRNRIEALEQARREAEDRAARLSQTVEDLALRVAQVDATVASLTVERDRLRGEKDALAANLAAATNREAAVRTSLETQLGLAQAELAATLDEGEKAVRWASLLDAAVRESRENHAKDNALWKDALERAENAARIKAAHGGALEDKLRRMQRSVSWRLTAPLRALRRRFIDPFTHSK